MHHICPYCGLNTEPLAYHEGAEDCQEAMRNLTNKLRALLSSVSPFVSAWEFDPYDSKIDGEKIHKELSKMVGLHETTV